MTLNLDSHMRLVGHPGHIVTEQGRTSGTLTGTVYGRFTVVTATNGTGTIVFYPKGGGSISGRASSHGHVVGANVLFSGTLSVTGGTGRWAHASGSGLTFTGVMNRQNLHVTSHLRGRIHV